MAFSVDILPASIELTPAVLHLHSLIEFCNNGAIFLDHVHDAGFLAYTAQFAGSRAVADKHLGTGLAHEPYCRTYDLGVRGHGINGRTCLEKVRLDEHPVSRLHKRLHSTEQINGLAYRVKGLAAVITTTSHYGNIGRYFFFHTSVGLLLRMP